MNDGKVPKLRFPGFKNLWKTKKYGELFEFHSTNSFSRDLLNYDKGEVYNIHYGDIHTKFSSLFHLEKENLPFINSETNLSNIKSESYCKEGDLVIADASEDYNDIGKTIEIISLNNQKVLAGLHTFLARPKNGNIGNGFFGYLVKTWFVRKQVMTIAQGTKVLGLSYKRLSKIDLPIPIIQEQQKIATFLSSVDKKLEQLQKKKELLEKYKKGMMQKIFKQVIRFKDENGNDFPDWEEKKLKNIISYTKGFAFKSKDYQTQGIRIVRVSDLLSGSIKSDVEKVFITPEKAQFYSKYQLRKGNIIITTVGSKPEMVESAVGRGIYINNDGEGLLNQNMLKFENNDIVNNAFLIGYINSNRYQTYIKGIARGNANQANITVVDLLNYKIQLPCIEEQTKIANFLLAIADKIDLVVTEIDKASQFKKGLLQQMFV